MASDSESRKFFEPLQIPPEVIFLEQNLLPLQFQYIVTPANCKRGREGRETAPLTQIPGSGPILPMLRQRCVAVVEVSVLLSADRSVH